MSYKSIIFSLVVASIVTGCSKSPETAAELAINEAQAQHPWCVFLPIGNTAIQGELAKDSALYILKEGGYIKEGTVTVRRFFEKPRETNGLVLTETGNNLVVPAKSIPYRIAIRNPSDQSPCIKTGVFKVKSVLAVDLVEAKMPGMPNATARVKFSFEPESWIAKTKNDPQWIKFWESIAEIEHAEWLFDLIRSGDAMSSDPIGRIFRK